VGDVREGKITRGGVKQRRKTGDELGFDEKRKTQVTNNK
jgi:hypothetical protein